MRAALLVADHRIRRLYGYCVDATGTHGFIAVVPTPTAFAGGLALCGLALFVVLRRRKLRALASVEPEDS